jgi:hypothetical protein
MDKYKVTLTEIYEIEAENERSAKLTALQKFSRKYNTELDHNKIPIIGVQATLSALFKGD